MAVFLLSMMASEIHADLDRGQALYENHCRFCHESWAHQRKKQKIGSLESLRAWVASWSAHSGLNWSEEEINDVTRYLNRRFYRLTE